MPSSVAGRYFEICKPRVVALIVFTAVVGMFLATPGWPPWNALLAGTLGIALASSSAAAINHLLDQRIDAVMMRTRDRPLPTGGLRSEQVLTFALALAAAVYARIKLAHDDPAAWAWPMAIAIACAPVIYPWYLLYLTPFLFTTATLPLAAWTISSLPVYEVWRRSRLGHRWITPAWVMAVEFGAVVAALVAVRRTFLRLFLPANKTAAHQLSSK